MSNFVVAPSLTEQVYNALINEICSGSLPPGSRLRQEALAETYNVSRQPIQQALLLLHSQGFAREAGRRGLEVAPMTATEIDNLYSTRAVIDSFAARTAASLDTDSHMSIGHDLLRRGEEALRKDSLSEIIAADIEFHQFIASLTENRILAEITAVVLRNVRRVMGEVILRSGAALSWREHASILAAIASSDIKLADELAAAHAERGRILLVAEASGDRSDA